MRVFKVSTPKGVKGGADVEKRVDGQGECGRVEVVGELFNISGVGEVIAESVGVEGNGHGVNRSRYCSQRDRRKTVRRRGGGTPPSLGSSRQRPRSIIDDRRRKRRRGRNGGCIVRHGDGFSGREVGSGRRRDEASYTG